MQKRCANTHLHDVLPETFEEVDGTCHACILAEGNQPIILLICYFFIVYQTDILLEESIQSWHAM